MGDAHDLADLCAVYRVGGGILRGLMGAWAAVAVSQAAAYAGAAAGVLVQRGACDVLIVLGLALGWIGDCALMLPNERYGGKPLLIGLGAFMLGHFMYIAHFVMQIGGVVSPWLAVILAPELCLGIWLYRVLAPGLGAMKPAVVAYEVVILLMSACAFGVLLSSPGVATVSAWVGSVCFIASDALLAIGIFIGERQHGHCGVMILYTVAQLLIALSAALM